MARALGAVLLGMGNGDCGYVFFFFSPFAVCAFSFCFHFFPPGAGISGLKKPPKWDVVQVTFFFFFGLSVLLSFPKARFLSLTSSCCD